MRPKQRILSSLVLGLAWPASAHAESMADGVYGRFEGDVSLSAAAGIEVDVRSPAPRPMVLTTARFYQAIGLQAGLSQAIDNGDRMERVGTLGVLVEPLFLVRWSNDDETLRPTWDLFVDSWALHLGAFLAEPRGGNFGETAGLDVGLGAGVPLLGWADGPWLRFRGSLRASPTDSATGVFQLLFEWQSFLESGFVGD